jgi:peptide/nickel transport system permease protein
MFLAGTIILFLGLLTIVGTLLSDLLLVLVDPRIRLEG